MPASATAELVEEVITISVCWRKAGNVPVIEGDLVQYDDLLVAHGRWKTLLLLPIIISFTLCHLLLATLSSIFQKSFNGAFAKASGPDHGLC